MSLQKNQLKTQKKTVMKEMRDKRVVKHTENKR